MKLQLPRTAAAALFLAATSLATNNPLTPDKLEADIKTSELQNVLWHLNHIAKTNGGNRAFGEPGFKASLDFVLERAQTRFGDRFDTYVQPFNHTYDKTLSIKVTGPDGKDLEVVVSPGYNPATPLPGGVRGALVNVPIDDVRGSGCLPEHWEGVDARGRIALVKRGVCGVAEKLKLAKSKGALGVILFNQDGNAIAVPNLGAENIGQLVPVAIITLAVGESWRARVAAGETLTVTLVVDAISERRETWNIITETKQGDPNKVVMLGAHLDSVQKGAGINDDGSGTAALLEILTAVRRYDNFPNKIRFAWWGAEENGLVGSLYYTSRLSEAEADKIKYYFNYDMIGSPQPDFSIARNNNSGIGPQLLGDYLVAKGKKVRFGGFGSGSDFVGFIQLGIPTASLHTGAGAPYDACYHQACDDIDNIDWDALTVNSKAAARAIATLANSLEGVPPRQKSSLNLRTRRGVLQSFQQWTTLAEEAGRGHTCSHKGEKTRV